MKIRRFVAKDMRTALLEIKEELGADAVIMSNKKIPEGVELMAAVDYSQSVAPSEPANDVEAQAQANPMDREIHDDTVSIGMHAVNQAPISENAVAHPEQRIEPTLSGTLNSTMTEQVAASMGSAQEAPADSLAALLNRQVQTAATPVNANMQTAANAGMNTTGANIASNTAGNAADENIEAQFKAFTERLAQAENPNISQNQHSSVNHGSASQPSNSQSELAHHGFSQGIDSESQVNTNAAQNVTELTQNQAHSGAAVDSASQLEITKMQQEMASIRQLLEHQLSGLMWQDMAQKDPSRALLVEKLTALGLTEQVADQIAGYVPTNFNEQEAWNAALTLVAEQINTTNNDIIHRGGVVALVGPTGVGKTTTIAKLAARFAQIHGADQVAMISTDSYRIAGFEQLVTYGRIIGCPVKQAKNDKELDLLLQQFSQKKLVLIDTAGMGQRDMRLAEHLTQLITNARVKIRNYLVLAANTQQRVMQENVERFKKVPISGCIYTKLDESLSVGEIIATSIQNGLPIGYLTDGQRVPEDIKVANAEKLVTLADKMSAKISLSSATKWKNVSHASANVA